MYFNKLLKTVQKIQSKWAVVGENTAVAEQQGQSA